MRLTIDQLDCVKRDIRCSPREFGYGQPNWTAPCLARHVNHLYGLSYSVRHCRRLIVKAQASRPTAIATSYPKKEYAATPGARAWAVFSEEQRHRRALAQLTRLCLVGLPLKQFSDCLFDQLTGATESGEAAQAICLGDSLENRAIFRNVETLEWTLKHLEEHNRANSDDSRITGMLIPSRKLKFVSEPVLPPWRFMAARFFESPSYHEVWKHHRILSGVMNVIRDNGRLLGFAPVWKSHREKPFTTGDLAFLQRAVPLISHGLAISQSAIQEALPGQEMEPGGTHFGIVTTDMKGRVLAIDQKARAIFVQTAMLDGRPLDAFTNTNLKQGCEYISSVVRQVFTRSEGSRQDEFVAPAARVWWHAAGIVLLLKAVLTERVHGTRLVTVLVEERQIISVRKQRLASKFGLTERESQVFSLARDATPRKEIAGQLGLSPNTVRTYLKQIAVKGLSVANAV